MNDTIVHTKMKQRRQYAHNKPRVSLPCRYVPAKPSRSKYDPATEDRKHANADNIERRWIAI